MNINLIPNPFGMLRERGLPSREKFSPKLLIALAAIPFFVLGGCKEKEDTETPKIVLQDEAVKPVKEDFVKRGEYLVQSIGCADCHSPKQMGQRGPEEVAGLRLSGYPQDRELPKVDIAALQNGWMLMNGDLTAAVGPWGVSFASNITSSETGIGTWSFEQFQTAMRQGKFKGMEDARDLLPPMPWQNFANLSDEDLKAIFHYLKSTTPVENVVPAPVPPTKLAAL